MFYTISLFMTILGAFLTSTVCNATLNKVCKSRALHSTCTPCHQNSHRLICTCTKTNKPKKNLITFMMGRIENYAARSRKATRIEDIDKVTSFRRNRLLSRAKIPGLVRNATGTRICAKTVQRRLKGVRLC